MFEGLVIMQNFYTEKGLKDLCHKCHLRHNI